MKRSTLCCWYCFSTQLTSEKGLTSPDTPDPSETWPEDTQPFIGLEIHREVPLGWDGDNEVQTGLAVSPRAISRWHRNPRGSWSLSELEGQCGKGVSSWRRRRSQGVGHKLVLHYGHAPATAFCPLQRTFREKPFLPSPLFSATCNPLAGKKKVKAYQQ